MKRQTSLLLFILIVSIIKSQSWTTSGNSTGAGAIFGTTSNQPINFYTNGTKKASLSTSGVFNLGGLAGSASRFLQVNSSGDLIEWNGNSGAFGNKVLYDDNTWKTLPFLTSGSNLGTSAGTKLGVGIENPTFALDVSGTAAISGDVKVQGNFFLNNGNNYAGMGFTPSTSNSPNIISFKVITGSSGVPTFTQAYKAPCNIFFPSPPAGQLPASTVFLTAATYGDLIQIYEQNSLSVLNLGALNNDGIISLEPMPSMPTTGRLRLNPGCSNDVYICEGGGETKIAGNAGIVGFLNVDGLAKLGTGTSASVPTQLDLIMNTSVTNAIRVSNSNLSGTNKDIFAVSGSGQAFFGANLQPVAGTALTIGQASKTDLALSLTDNTSTTNVSFFNVWGDGLTEIRSSNSSRALSIYDGQSSVAKFEVAQNGFTSIKTSNTKAFSISNVGSSVLETFSIDKSGYTEIKVQGTMPTVYGNTARALTVRDVVQNKDIFVVKADGKVYAREVEISLTTNFPDYVFEKNYDLKSIPELAGYVKTKKHLPGFENAAHYEKNGLNVSSMIVKQQEKIEELTLYIIQLEERIRSIENSK